MHKRSGAQGMSHASAQITTLLWNDLPFDFAPPIGRETSIVRTRPVTPAQRRKFNETGWPHEFIKVHEHRLHLVGRDTTIALITTAAEGEDEFPERIVTPVRDLGLYLDATLFWRGREDSAIVSVRVTSLKDRRRFALATAEPQPDQPAKPDPVIASVLAAALRVIKSGIVITEADLPRRMSERQRELANFLLARRADDGERPLSLDDIGKILGCSDETVRRRQMRLEKKFPELAAVFRSFRSRNQKGEAVSPLHPHHDPTDATDPQLPEE